MSANKEHIDLKRLKDYFSGNMSAEEMHAMEIEAQHDPFLFEAMEGYESFPDGLERVNKLKQQSAKSGRSFFGKGTLTIIGITTIVYLTALLIKPEINEPKAAPETAGRDVQSYQEIEVLPMDIDTFVYAEEIDQITPQEIIKSKPAIVESNEERYLKMKMRSSLKMSVKQIQYMPLTFTSMTCT